MENQASTARKVDRGFGCAGGAKRVRFSTPPPDFKFSIEFHEILRFLYHSVAKTLKINPNDRKNNPNHRINLGISTSQAVFPNFLEKTLKNLPKRLDTFGTHSGHVRDTFGTRSGHVRDTFGTCSGQILAPQPPFCL